MEIEKRILLSFVTLFSLLDLITTYLGLSRGFTEGNIFLASSGDLMFMVMGILKVSVILLSYFLLRRGYILPVIVVIALMGFAVINNVFLLT